MINGHYGSGGMSSGYVSGGIGTDTESARLSNVQPYKYNIPRNKNKAADKNPVYGLCEIKKINPNNSGMLTL